MIIGIAFGPGAFAAAFAAGFLAFVSPCVLPLIPGYLSFVSGVGFDEIGARTRRVVGTTALFVAGFAAMFVLLGAGVGWFGTALLVNRRPLEIASGAFIVVAGILYAGLPMPRALLAERRVHVRRMRGGPATPALAGVAFAIGWTPCISPTLGGILVLSGTGGHPGQGALLLAVYSLGLGLPFLAAGVAFTRTLAVMKVLRRNWRVVSLASGATMVAFGVLLALGQLTQITAQLSGT